MQPQRKKRKVGRPPMRMPDPIPDTPENVIDAVLNTPPRKRDEWKFVQEKRAKETTHDVEPTVNRERSV